MAQDAGRERDRRDCADRGEDEQIRSREPSIHDRKVLCEGVNEDDDEEDQDADREHADLPVRCVADVRLAFPDQPAGAEKGVAKAQSDPARHGKRCEPAEVAARISTVRDLQPFHQCANRHSLHEAREQGSACKAQIPYPAHPLRLVAKLECYSTQDQTQQHDDEREIECRQQRRIDDREGAPQDHTADHQPSFVAVPNRCDGALDGVTLGVAVCQAEQHADAEVDTVEQHVEQNADGQKGDPEHDHGYSPAPAWPCWCTGLSAASDIGRLGTAMSGISNSFPTGPVRMSR